MLSVSHRRLKYYILYVSRHSLSENSTIQPSTEAMPDPAIWVATVIPKLLKIQVQVNQAEIKDAIYRGMSHTNWILKPRLMTIIVLLMALKDLALERSNPFWPALPPAALPYDFQLFVFLCYCFILFHNYIFICMRYFKCSWILRKGDRTDVHSYNLNQDNITCYLLVHLLQKPTFYFIKLRFPFNLISLFIY